ncbi:hypothetical protein [Paraburkholderia megapolitana]|uniref:Uncharacterized protein n=1 Tax=Paraburkholderia megapolitana TaxID=420953 RepID=A0A1I3RAE2_9BURK|nr:hypothetical protein [Paraburkholderia megapolitana]QDQ83737.1 hypothetical protein FNZ07_21500 [Paraburkholderia megapolitana]SFJ42341.1 hypothetical protein SAMN05192543_10786 [Paraburkholderia megapolitana]
MDRRTFVATSAWLAATAGYTWPAFARVADTRGTLAVVDLNFAHGRAFAQHAAGMSMATVEVGDDIGALWHSVLVSHLAGTGASLVGVVRASDSFVLAHLANRFCRIAQQVLERDAVNTLLVTFVLKPATSWT